ncbi:hypothetical protein Scep_017362 [Stephania cephalantha]|uniref:Uncharacterized protein n=1 Tax=Stephania cephalantha TaxID=152367 RepID=A0AAP0IPF6_9MAGN
MGFCPCRMLVLLVCLGLLLLLQPEQVSGLRSIDMVLRTGREERGRQMIEEVPHMRILMAVSEQVAKLNTKDALAPGPSGAFDSYQLSKRRVRRGSDPIHNRC